MLWAAVFFHWKKKIIHLFLDTYDSAKKPYQIKKKYIKSDLDVK